MIQNSWQKWFFILIILFFVGFFTFAEEVQSDEYFAFDFTGSYTGDYNYPMLSGQPDPKSLYDEIRGAMDYRSPWFDLLIDWGMRNDGKYNAEEQYFGGRYFAMHDTRIDIHDPDDNFTITAGRGPHKDAVDSPYSVFINSTDIPAFHIEASYHNDFFFYTTRWVELNSNSMYQYLASEVGDLFFDGSLDTSWGAGYTGEWLDKGANYKTFGINLEDWRIGFQDIVVYLDRSFDAEYFFNPMPQYFVQLINTAFGRPWSQAGNAKSYMGFFADRTQYDNYFAVQLLMDDLNASFFPGFDQSSAIKTKIAWSLSGWKDFDFGRIGLFHGGATKYTFEATYTAHHYEMYMDDPGFIEIPYSIFPYEATYVPITQYTTEDGEEMAINYTDNYISYKYGENNIAFMMDYQNLFYRDTPLEFGLYSSFEWVLNGSKSPSNPWHEYYSGTQIDEKIALLDGTVEHIFRLSTAIRKPVGKNLILNLDLIAGIAINAMKLVFVTPVDSDVVDYDDSWDEPKIYVPQSGLIEPIIKVTIGGTWHIPVK